MRGVQDFYNPVTDAHIVAAAMSHLSMPSIESAPPGMSALTEKEELRDFMMHIVGS